MRFSRDNVARYTLYVAAFLVVIGTCLQVWHWYHVSMDKEAAAVVLFFGLIIAAVASSLLASASYSLFHELAAWNRTKSDQAALSSVLYHSMHGELPKCYIVLPRYAKKLLVESPSSQYRPSDSGYEVDRQGPTGPVMSSRPINTAVGSQASSCFAGQAASSGRVEIEMPYEHHACEDVRCAVELHALLVHAGAASVDWVNPEEMEKIIANTVPEPCVMLCVGLFSNKCVKALASDDAQEMFRMNEPTFTIASKATNSPGGGYRFNIDSDRVDVTVPPQQTKFDAFVLRLALKENLSCVIVGGVSAEGTQAIGKYIRLYWKKLIWARDNNSHCGMRDREFIVHVSARPEPQLVTIERVVVGNEVASTLAPRQHLGAGDIGPAA